ncbi:sulfite exporter TauE/SafE family protein [Owenweeksia hongkongensis]|uniref:sulfite exporter TauE/SafE family protein n=1 Tax=Owenweeksia hongkongensis TaxID=253245 RepID=UPI003A8D9854
MEILGYLLSIVMGLTLGLLGGGGSILTVPILVYVLAIDPVLATAYSLFVVGATSVIGGWRKHTENLVEWKIGLVFAAPSLVAVFLTRYYLVPAIPEEIFTAGSFTLTKNIAIMTFFGIVMLFASTSMIKGSKNGAESKDRPFNLPLILIEGLVVGTVTGLVGAGGGFLIVPALVLLVGLPIKKAVGTSLIIIAIKSLIGFLGDIGSGQDIDWGFLGLFTVFSAIGMFIGIYATRFISADGLKKAFGWFVLLMGIFIIYKELF